MKYFSGVATYTRRFKLPRSIPAGAPLVLDLGNVGDIAEVWLNDRLIGTAWHPPYQVELTTAVKSGINRLEVRVANVWVNRLIGDKQPEAAQITWTAAPTYTAKAPLRPSGLLGPVQLMMKTN